MWRLGFGRPLRSSPPASAAFGDFVLALFLLAFIVSGSACW